jgi:hypothetical protein
LVTPFFIYRLLLFAFENKWIWRIKMEKLTPEQIAKTAMDKINADKKDKEEKLNLDEKKQAESKGAAPESSPEKEKTEDEKSKILKEAEEKAKKDEDLLTKKEEELSEEEKARKKELLEKKPKELNEDKVNKRKAELQAEIDKLVSQKKELEDVKQQSEKMKQELADLQKGIETLKKEQAKVEAEKNIPEEQKLLKKKEAERLQKYLEDDKELPKEERREMSKEELEEWLLEDVVSASEWMTERSLRRSRERLGDMNNTKREKLLKEFTARQKESDVKVLAKHPDLNTSTREKELRDQGKEDKEIHDILCKENEKYRICSEIVKENPEMYLSKTNGPELVAKEMEKRLEAKTSKKEEESTEKSEIEKLQAELEAKEAEIERLKNLDETLGSSRLPEKKTEEKKSEFELKQEALAKRAGISPEALKKAKDRRAKIVGAGV